ncbi:MAG: citryl-CoA lyase [Alphaproteobacteria bacterium]|nr:citryl-CoA lyase [Alphaproteobacteria bacterium]
MAKPVTRIGTPTSRTDVLKMRGKDTLSDIVGKRSFTETFYFIVTGKLPNAMQTKVFDACLIILMDHGITPNALVARMVEEACPEDVQIPIAAGLLMVGNKYAGTMTGAAVMLSEGIKAPDHRAWAADYVAKARAAKRRIAGFGHPYYFPDDPRAARLFEVAREAGVDGKYIRLIKLVSEEIDKGGKHLTLNVTGAMGALLCEIDFPIPVMRGVSVIGRAAGLVSHIYEEKTNGNAVANAVIDLVNNVEYQDPA